MLEFVSPNEEERMIFFSGLEIKDKKKDKTAPSGVYYDTPEKKLLWYRQKWVAIFQYPVLSLIIGIVTDITEAVGVYCDNSFSPQFANLWTFIVSNVSVTIAVTSILVMFLHLKKHIAGRKPLAKLIVFKLVVGLSFVQGILFTILRDTNIMEPTEYLTYADIKVGIPTMVLCIEMVPMAILFHYAYSYRPYYLDQRQAVLQATGSPTGSQPPLGSYQGGFLGWRAILQAIDPRDYIHAFVFAFNVGTEMLQYRLQANQDQDSIERPSEHLPSRMDRRGRPVLTNDFSTPAPYDIPYKNVAHYVHDC